MPPKRTSKSPTPIEAISHADKRVNIPTEELRDFVAEDEAAPAGMRYPRDPSLDPQLVWRGKDEQDGEDLQVPVVPVYIQEKIHPQALIENLRDTARAGEPEPELTLFDDFNGIGFELMVEFYQHEQNWANRMILGDSLLVMTSLAEKEGLKGKVQMIYLDPPYGIKFGSNWQISTRKRDVKDGKEEDLTRQPEQIRAFRDTWELGIHSYLSYLRDRFVVARELLTETGSIFVQIGDENVHLVRCVLDEVFGSGSFCAVIVFKKTVGLGSTGLTGNLDFILWYAKDCAVWKHHDLYTDRTLGEDTGYVWVDGPAVAPRRMTTEEKTQPEALAPGLRPFCAAPLLSSGYTPSCTFPFTFEGRIVPAAKYSWKTTPDGVERLIRAERLVRPAQLPNYKLYAADMPVEPTGSYWGDVRASEMRYTVQTANKVIERCLLMATDPGDLVLDPTCVRKGTRVVVPVGDAPSPTLPASGEGALSPPLAEKGGGSPPPFTGEVGRGAGSSPPFTGGTEGGAAQPPASATLAPIDALHPGDLVYAHDGCPHRVARVIQRHHRGEMVGLRTDGRPVLWLTADHRVLAKPRPRTLGGNRDWSSAPLEHLERRRQLRREATAAETRLWRRLRRGAVGPTFRRQHPIGPYIADFYSREAHLVVEVDGDSHFTPEGLAHDLKRDRHLRGLGLDVLHFTNEDIRTNADGICFAILAQCERRRAVEHGAEWVQAGRLVPGDVVFTGTELRPVEIREVQPEMADEVVYDLEVEGAHSFITETCVVHNCGSGTTAFVAEQWGRRWVTCDTSRVALALARTRLMAAKYPHYLLADSRDGMMRQAEVEGRLPGIPLPDPPRERGGGELSAPVSSSPVHGGGREGGIPERFNHDVRRGFVYRRVPHVTLKSIANNEEIDAIHDRWQEQLEPLRARLNQAAGQSWEEWEVPRPEAPSLALPASGEGTGSPPPFAGEAGRGASPDLPAAARPLLDEWWDLRRKRQREIDDSIARRAEFELLYDQPYEDSKRIRVSGPFTVESLSPHRVLEASADLPGSVAEGKRDDAAGQFEALVLENLRVAGVQNTVKNERLRFDTLEPHAGRYIHATGEYTDAGGAVRRAAVTIGPEHGTVGPQLVKEAAKEAVQGIGYDVLILCGFAFDPHVSEEAKRYGKLTVLPTHMNPDLAMGDVLKKTGAGNLFMIFGEPDLEVVEQSDGKLVVKLRGVDVYDPTTGEVRSNTTDDIACWFIDTSYNGESFFVRHAYFTGADEPYDKLKRALRAEINEEVWSALYSTESLAFDRPSTGRIAVKVINHYGDEVLKVYEV